MKEKTQTGASETARAKFDEATVFLRDRAEISITVKAEMSSAFLKAHLKAMGEPFTQADVTLLQSVPCQQMMPPFSACRSRPEDIVSRGGEMRRRAKLGGQVAA